MIEQNGCVIFVPRENAASKTQSHRGGHLAFASAVHIAEDMANKPSILSILGTTKFDFAPPAKSGHRRNENW